MLAHASAIAVDGKGVLLLGESGSGKSDLALRLLHEGASLIADDQVLISASGNGLLLNAPESIRGLLEVRGIGILPYPYLMNVPLSLSVRLVPREEIDRLPPPRHYTALGHNTPELALCAFDASSPAKIIAALHYIPKPAA